MDLSGKRVTIIGLAESGFSAAGLLKRLNARVRISESSDGDDIRARLKKLDGAEFEVGGHTRSFIENSDLLVVSPGVSINAEPLRWAAHLGIPAIGELELGAMFCNAPIIAVTGTNGKSTTASLIHEMLKSNGIKSYLLGNIGRPICADVLDVSSDSAVVLEVSSFQLETIMKFRPKIAVLLNLTRDHLDRYPDMDEYIKAKLRLFENQENGDRAILNYDDPAIRGLSDGIKSEVFYFSMNKRVRGSYLEGGRLFVDLGNGPIEIASKDDMNSSGMFILENVLAAALALKLIDAEADASQALREFIGLRHRFELAAEIEGVSFLDDSKSTTVDSTLRALKSFSKKSVILIAGGRDKGSDYSPLAGQAGKLKHLVLIGEAQKKIRADLGSSDIPVEEVRTMEDAVSFSAGIAEEGDVVLLSPMCSSFDMFRDYRERGDVFRKAVLDLLSNYKCIV